MAKRFILFILFLKIINVNAAIVDTVNIYSKAMNKEFKCVVIQPVFDQNKSIRVPVVYLLHGFGGWYSNWITRAPELKDYADRYQLMIVCPEGLNSWYFDSPVDPSYRFETYISKEIPEYIDSHYLTINDRTGRAITGLSMGGHGGLFIGIRHADFFGACGSMSGGVDLNYSRNKFDVAKRIGDTINHAENWKTYSVIDLVEHMTKDTAAMIIDCGYNDIFYKDNHALHEKMLRLNIPHEYTERPGKHEWAYWKNSIQYHLLFFSNYFQKNKALNKEGASTTNSAIVEQNAKIFKPGETLEIKAGLGELKRISQTKIFISGTAVPLNEKGYAIYKIQISSQFGKHSIPVTIKFFNEVTGKEETINKDIQYTVVKD